MSDEPLGSPWSELLAGPSWVGERRRVRVRRKRRSKRRRYVLVGVAAGALIVLAWASWLAWDGLHARAELHAVQAQVHTLRAQVAAGDLAAARATASTIEQHASAADGYVGSFAWTVGRHLPFVGSDLGEAHDLATVVGSIAHDALPQLVDAATVLDPSRLRRSDGSLDLAAMSSLRPELDAAHATLVHASAVLAGIRASGWGSINSARASLAAELPSVTHSVGNADLAVRLAPPLLGASGPRNYLITFQNDAEMRATGGLPGAMAVLRVRNGKLHFTDFEPDNYLVGTTAQGVDFPGSYDTLYGTSANGAHAEYRNTNLSPHYPYAAQLWLAMWRHKTGEQLDGAITLDPTALSYLLAVSGPATMPDGTVVSASNVVALTESTVYAKFPQDNAARKQYLLDIARAVSQKLAGLGNAASLVRAAAHAAGESRLLLWVRDPSIESSLAGLPLGGAEPVTSAPYFRLALWNSTGSKLDYYLHASVDWTSTTCGSRSNVTVTVQLHNAAPAGLPRYVLGETADPQFGIPHGDEYLALLAYGTHNAVLTSYTVNGRQSDAVSRFEERGHPVWSDGRFVPRGKTLTVVYKFRAPASSAAPMVPAQPMVNPMTVSVHSTHC